MDSGLLIWTVALSVLVIVGVVWILDLQSRFNRLKERQETVLTVTGTDDPSLAAALDGLTTQLAEASARTERLTARVEQAEKTASQAVQGVGLVRFRAFQDTGGDQSFALALADGEGNGVVISALYGRNKTRIYAKPVECWLSPKALGEEEERALTEARQQVLSRD
jgi:hypothetical protein